MFILVPLPFACALKKKKRRGGEPGLCSFNLLLDDVAHAREMEGVVEFHVV